MAKDNGNDHQTVPAVVFLIIAFLSVLSVITLVVIIPITGIPVRNNEGQYRGYVTAVERNGAIFRGWNAYLKTELESSNEDVACINREDHKLIERLKTAQENNEKVTLEYEGVWLYGVGKCPNSDWMIVRIK